MVVTHTTADTRMWSCRWISRSLQVYKNLQVYNNSDTLVSELQDERGTGRIRNGELILPCALSWCCRYYEIIINLYYIINFKNNVLIFLQHTPWWLWTGSCGETILKIQILQHGLKTSNWCIHIWKKCVYKKNFHLENNNYSTLKVLMSCSNVSLLYLLWL